MGIIGSKGNTMKIRILMSILIIMLSASACLAQAEKVNTMSNLTTLMAPYYVMRAEANGDANLVDPNAHGDFAHMPATALDLYATFCPNTGRDTDQSRANGLKVIFSGGTASGQTFSYRIYAWGYYGPAQLVCSGTGTLGAQAVVTYPIMNGGAATNRYYAHVLTIDNTTLWPTVRTYNSGLNRICWLKFDACGFRFFYVEVTNASGTAPQAGNIQAYCSAY
jgi:hypothetical protein